MCFFLFKRRDMTHFPLKHTVKQYGLREGKQRLEKFVKYVLFAKAEQKLEKIVKNKPFEQQREHFGGQSRAFSWKKPLFLIFLHPHPDLILKAVRYAERQKARGVICITAWQRHRHENTLFPGGHIPTWAKEILYIYPVFEKHKLQNVSSFDGHISSPCFLARFDFTINNDWSPQNTEESCLWPPSCSNCCDKM